MQRQARVISAGLLFTEPFDCSVSGTLTRLPCAGCSAAQRLVHGFTRVLGAFSVASLGGQWARMALGTAPFGGEPVEAMHSVGRCRSVEDVIVAEDFTFAAASAMADDVTELWFPAREAVKALTFFSLCHESDQSDRGRW